MTRYALVTILSVSFSLVGFGCYGKGTSAKPLPPGLAKQGKVLPGHAKKHKAGSLEIKGKGVKVKVK